MQKRGSGRPRSEVNRLCVICGAGFVPKRVNQRLVKNDKVYTVSRWSSAKTCSKECAGKLISERLIARSKRLGLH